jgi:hypothetical protein
MEQEGWSIEPSGRIVNSPERTIFKAGFATAIKNYMAMGSNHSLTKLFNYQRTI